jgi:hypothetical protein
MPPPDYVAVTSDEFVDLRGPKRGLVRGRRRLLVTTCPVGHIGLVDQ